MKAKKLITLCLVGMLAVASTSSVLANTSTGTGNADFTLEYSNSTGPTDPTDPTDPTGGANNWQVSYPKAIVLSDDNSYETNDVVNINAGIFANSGYNPIAGGAVNGKQIQFTVSRRTAGTDGNNYEVTTENVGNNGIKVQVKPGSTYTWGNGTSVHKALINMNDSKGSAAEGVYMVMMQSTSGKNAGASQQNKYLLSSSAGGDSSLSQDPVAVLKANSVPSGTISGENISKDAEVAIVGKTDTSDTNVGIQDGNEYTANVKFAFTKA